MAIITEEAKNIGKQRSPLCMVKQAIITIEKKTREKHCICIVLHDHNIKITKGGKKHGFDLLSTYSMLKMFICVTQLVIAELYSIKVSE